MTSVGVLPMLVDCGRVSKRTRGLEVGPFLEANVPPYNRYYP